MNDSNAVDAPLAALTASTRAATAAIGPSVVSIGRRGRGSGFVVGPDRVLTNAHNLRDRTVLVTFPDGRAVQGEVLGTDPDHDLVVLDVPTEHAPAVTWSDVVLEAGDVVFAVGRSPATLRVTFGVVSASDRAFRGPRGRRVKGAIEHTAPLARGSSGGPVVDAEGRLLAINTHRLGEGFYLAQPADAELRRRVEQMSSGAHLRGRRLGIAVTGPEDSARSRRRVGLEPRDGLLVTGVVEGSPAAAVGVSAGDLVIAVAGVAISSVDDLWDALDDAAEQVEVELLRGTTARTVVVSFADGPAPAGQTETPKT